MQPSPISIQGQKFTDQQGRQVLLHGIGLVDKNPKNGYLEFLDPELFSKFREWGFNCVRLGVIWDGLEPEPGIYNKSYLQGIDQQVEYARQNNLYVFLDMHQDLFSVLFSDGAPEWATITDGSSHIDASEVWSDAYFTSPAIHTALDHFWNNTPAPDGLGLQDHYAAIWGALARRYAGDPTVIGYDLMNEPFPGSVAVQAQELMFAKGAEILAATGMFGDQGARESTGNGNPAEELMQFWLTPEGRSAILQILRDLEIYTPVIDVQAPFYNQFERTRLMEMYNRVARAIRQEDLDGMLFLETTMASNMGVYSAIEPVIGAQGRRDPHQVYAPHGYDLVTDTPNLDAASPERIELIFQRHAATSRRLGMPMLVGEWGAFGNQPGTLLPAWQVVGIFEQLLCSETFWAYFPGVDKTPSFPAVQRPYLERAAGEFVSYHYDPATGQFACEWQEDGTITAPTRIYLPDWFNYIQKKVSINSNGDDYQFIPVSPGSDSVYLEIDPTGQVLRRKLSCA